jgi:hypothetical protein
MRTMGVCGEERGGGGCIIGGILLLVCVLGTIFK